MTFKPPSGRTATELIHEQDLEGYIFGDENLQYVQGGTLNLTPMPDTGLAHDGTEFGWPWLHWHQFKDLQNPPGLVDWGYQGDVNEGGDFSSPQWTPEGSYLVLHSPSTVYDSYIRQASDETGTFWSDNANNDTGYVIESHLQVAGDSAFMTVDDGTRRVRLHLIYDRVRVEGRPELDIVTEMGRPRAFRFIAQGDDFHILMDDGMSVSAEGGFTGTSVTKELAYGLFTGEGPGTLLMDRVHQFHGGAVIDEVPPGTPVYSTSFVGTTLPQYAPGIVLIGWDEAIFDLDGSNDGTTRIVIEYRSSSTPAWTQSGGTTTLSTTPRHTVDISSVPVAGDGSDEIRFRVEQSSTDGTGKPYGVTQAMLTANAEGGTLKLYPTWGPQYGSTAAIDIPQSSMGAIQFPVQSNWPAETDTELLYHFDELSGAPQDDSGNAYHGTIPGGSASATLQAQNGWFGYGIHVVDGGGQLDVPVAANLDYNQDVTISFFCKLHTRTTTGLIWEHKSGSRGVEIRVNTSGQLEVLVTNGGGSDTTHTHTGALIGTDSWTMVWVKLLTTSDKIRTRVTGSDWEESATAAQDYYTGLTGTAATMFAECWGTFDEFHWLGADRDESTWDSLSLRNVRRSVFTTPKVYVDGDEVTGERVNYYHPNRIYVQMPPHDPEEVAVWVEETGVDHYVPDGYRYVRAYAHDVSEELEAAQACQVKSPFRIGYSVSEGDVNLSLIQGPELAVESHMSRVGLEHLEADNLAAYRQGEFALTSPDTGADNYAYPGLVDTDDLLISTKSPLRRDFRQGRPLFYKYLVGRGRHYLHHQDAAVTDIDMIRRSIRIEDRNGRVVRPEDYPWEIDVSSTDFYGNPLPANTFSVVLYTERVGQLRRTFFVVYNAVDARSGWERQDGHKEVINPVPLFERDASLAGDFQFDASLEDTGYYSLTVTK